MKRGKLLMVGLLSLMIASCSNQQEDQKPEHHLRADVIAPQIVSVEPSSYVDEKSGNRVDFKIRSERDDDAEILFRKFVFRWNLKDISRQWQPQANETQLPYFIVTINDADTLPKDRKLYFYFSPENDDDDVERNENFREAQKAPLGAENQWVVILCEETIGSMLTSFYGKKTFTLHLKAVDKAGNHSFSETTFAVDNLKPDVVLRKDPLDLEISNYPLRNRHIFYGEKRDENIKQLRTGQKFTETISFTKFLVENRNAIPIYVRISLEKGRIDYFQKRYHQKWDNDVLRKVLLSKVEFLNAPIVADVKAWNGSAELAATKRTHLDGFNSVYLLPPKDDSLDKKGRSGLVYFILTDLNFAESTMPGAVYDTRIQPNLFADILTLTGVLKLHVAPAGMSEGFYREESNWIDMSQPIELPMQIYSEK